MELTMNNDKVKELLIEQYGALLEEPTDFFIQPRDDEFFFELNNTKAYSIRNPWDASQPKVPTVETCVTAFGELCAAAGIFLNETVQGTEFVGDGTGKFDFLKIPVRGVIVAITVIEAPSSLGAVQVIGQTADRCFALVTVYREDSQINSQGNEFIAQTMNLKTGKVHTCLFRLAVAEDQDTFPVYVPKMVSVNGYYNAQEAVDNQAEDVKNMVPVADFTE
ncbi:hypothetical protein VPy01_60 [Vibrio phage VPy01]|nr:hypothetical protein VPy01_60 [Vibrio phage VPy01]